MKTVRLVVSGRVQRVAFRHYAQREADALGIVGYVRNLTGGQVEIVAQGSSDALESMQAWAAQGPPLARVTDVQLTELNSAENYTTFSVER